MAPLASRRPCLPLALLLSLAVLWVPPAQAEAGWETVHRAENLLVQRRPYAGSPLQEIRGELQVRARLGELVALLRDADFNREWVYRSGGARILRENGHAQAWVYGIVDAPWPMRDRDTVVRFDYSQQAGGGVIHIDITNAPEFTRPVDGYVRVPDFGGFWELRPRPGGLTTVIYQVYGDPGGLVPVWLANYAAVTSVIRTLQNLPAAVARYHGARPQFVREPEWLE